MEPKREELRLQEIGRRLSLVETLNYVADVANLSSANKINSTSTNSLLLKSMQKSDSQQTLGLTFDINVIPFLFTLRMINFGVFFSST